MIAFFKAGSDEKKVEGGDAALEKNSSRCGFTSSRAVVHEEAISHKFSSRSQTEQNSALIRAMLSFFGSLRNCISTWFEVTLKKTKVLRCFRRVVLYFCENSETEDLLAFRHGADRYRLCVKCTICLEEMVQSTKSPSFLLAKTAETQRQIRNPKVMAGMVSERGQQ